MAPVGAGAGVTATDDGARDGGGSALEDGDGVFSLGKPAGTLVDGVERVTYRLKVVIVLVRRVVVTEMT